MTMLQMRKSFVILTSPGLQLLVRFKKAIKLYPGSGTITHNTNDSYIKITYPFHPLFGQFLPLIHETNKPEPAFICRIDDFRQLNVPKWMTEPSAENFSISEIPVINPFSLLESIALVKEYFQFDPPFHPHSTVVGIQKQETHDSKGIQLYKKVA